LKGYVIKKYKYLAAYKYSRIIITSDCPTRV
jgi:hypothetical protein